MKQLGSRGKSICRDSANGPQETIINLITNLHEVIRMIGLVMMSTLTWMNWMGVPWFAKALTTPWVYLGGTYSMQSSNGAYKTHVKICVFKPSRFCGQEDGMAWWPGSAPDDANRC